MLYADFSAYFYSGIIKRVNMKIMNVMLMAIFSGAMTMGCGNTSKTVTVADLAGEWEILKVKGKSVKAEETPFLGFDVTEKQLYGNAGCNSLMGTLEIDEEKKNALSFGAVGSTKRMCADMSAENAILPALEEVKGFSLEGENLVLTNEAGNEVLELRKRP